MVDKLKEMAPLLVAVALVVAGAAASITIPLTVTPAVQRIENRFLAIENKLSDQVIENTVSIRVLEHLAGQRKSRSSVTISEPDPKKGIADNPSSQPAKPSG